LDIAKLFRNGRSQAVRLPAAYRFEGDAVRISRRGRAVILEPLVLEPKDWFAELDRLGGLEFAPDWRSQPEAPKRDVF
jgi:antitoxin VapB